MLKDLEEDDVDRDVAGVEVGDDPFGGIVQFGGYKDDLVGLVERILVQFRAEVLLEGLAKIAAFGETLEDLRDFLRAELLDPRGVVQRLGDDFPRGAIPFEFDQNKRTVRRDGQKVNNPTEASALLPADQHPFAGENARRADNHLFQRSFARELACDQGFGSLTDFPNGVFDGHEIVNVLGALMICSCLKINRSFDVRLQANHVMRFCSWTVSAILGGSKEAVTNSAAFATTVKL